jgi:Single-strand binding protein family
MSIDCAFHGVLSKEPERKTSQGGRAYLRLSVRVGAGDGAVWLDILCFADVDELGGRLHKDSKVYLEGQISAKAYLDQRTQSPRASLSVMSWHVIETHRIGRNRCPKGDRDSGAQAPPPQQEALARSAAPQELDDTIPF